LALAETMCNPVNLLVLDEPTNHLDLPSCDVLEDALRAYPGTVLLVSHDRYLIRNTMEELVVVRDGTVVHHHEVDESILSPGVPVLAQRSTGSTEAGSGGAAATSPRNGSSTAGSSGKGSSKKTAPPAGRDGAGGNRRQQRRDEAEQRRQKAASANGRNARDLRKKVNRLEEKAAKAEAEVSELEVQLAAPEVYADKDLMNDLIDRHETARRRADRLLAEWEEASTALERAESAS
jgi:ATP-binding cassette subfamily F protein 3